MVRGGPGGRLGGRGGGGAPRRRRGGRLAWIRIPHRGANLEPTQFCVKACVFGLGVRVRVRVGNVRVFLHQSSVDETQLDDGFDVRCEE